MSQMLNIINDNKEEADSNFQVVMEQVEATLQFLTQMNNSIEDQLKSELQEVYQQLEQKDIVMTNMMNLINDLQEQINELKK